MLLGILDQPSAVKDRPQQVGIKAPWPFHVYGLSSSIITRTLILVISNKPGNQEKAALQSDILHFAVGTITSCGYSVFDNPAKVVKSERLQKALNFGSPWDIPCSLVPVTEPAPCTDYTEYSTILGCFRQ